MFPWISFITYIIIMAFTPGQNNIMSMNNAKNAGFKNGITFNFGILAGFFTVMILCLFFSTVLFTLIPKIEFPMKIFGALYMVYLIIITIIPKKEHDVKNKKSGFIVGALLQFINPKIMIYGITAMSSFILPFYREIPVLLLFSFLLSFVGFTATICWALFGSLFNKLFSRHAKILNVIMVILLMYCVVSLFL